MYKQQKAGIATCYFGSSNHYRLNYNTLQTTDITTLRVSVTFVVTDLMHDDDMVYEYIKYNNKKKIN